MMFYSLNWLFLESLAEIEFAWLNEGKRKPFATGDGSWENSEMIEVVDERGTVFLNLTELFFIKNINSLALFDKREIFNRQKFPFSV